MSIVDYLKSTGQDSSFASRTALATQKGITNYTGTAEQNTQLLGMLQSPTAPTTTLNASTSTNQVVPAPNSTISLTPFAGSIQGYDTNNNWNPVYVPKGQYVPGISATPKVITPDSLGTVNNLNIPAPIEPNTTQAPGMVAGANEELKQIMAQFSAPETDASKKQQSVLDEMLGLVKEQGQKGADQLSLEQSSGIPELNKQLGDLNAQILSKKAEYDAIESAYEKANVQAEGTPKTMARLQGQQAQNYRMYLAERNAKASEMGLLRAQAQGLQGKIEIAQATVDRAIDLKYSTIEARLNTYQAQLNALKPTLDKEERLQAQAQQILLDRQSQALADEKAKEKEKSDLLLSYINDYKDAGINLSDSLETAQAKLRNSKIYQQQTRLAGGGGGSDGGGAGFDFSTSPGVIETPQPQRIQIPFDQYLREEELKARQSFSPEKRAELKKLYDAANTTPTQKGQTADLSKYDFRVQRVIRGEASPESLTSGGTAKERTMLTKQLTQAQKEGLLKPQPSEKQKATLNSIVDKYNKSPLIAAADRTIVLKNAANQIKSNPGSGTAQLNLVYSYIQALDTYQSAVREGELGLVNSIDSTYGKLKNNIEKIQNGQIVRPEVAKQIADAALTLVTTISQGAQAKEKAFASQARVNGIEDLWKDYTGGFEAPFEQNQSTSGQTSSGIKYTVTK